MNRTRIEAKKEQSMSEDKFWLRKNMETKEAKLETGVKNNHSEKD